MLSDGRPAVMPIRTGPVQIQSVRVAAIFRLKSWRAVRTDRDGAVVLGDTTLPVEIGTTTTGALHALCVAPGEWVLATKERIASSLREQMRSALSEQSIAFTDL